jgi:hypothetical protein
MIRLVLHFPKRKRLLHLPSFLIRLPICIKNMSLKNVTFTYTIFSIINYIGYYCWVRVWYYSAYLYIHNLKNICIYTCIHMGYNICIRAHTLGYLNICIFTRYLHFIENKSINLKYHIILMKLKKN